MKQKFVPVFIPDDVAQLLQRPGGARMRCDVTVNQPATVVLDNYKHIQKTKGRRHGDEEIAGNDSLSVQA